MTVPFMRGDTVVELANHQGDSVTLRAADLDALVTTLQMFQRSLVAGYDLRSVHQLNFSVWLWTL